MSRQSRSGLRESQLPIRVDLEADAAYITIRGGDNAGETVTQVAVEDDRLHGDVVIDLDRDVRFVGIEILGWRSLAPDRFPNGSFTP